MSQYTLNEKTQNRNPYRKKSKAWNYISEWCKKSFRPVASHWYFVRVESPLCWCPLKYGFWDQGKTVLLAKNDLKERFLILNMYNCTYLVTIWMTLTGSIMLWSEYSWKLPKCTSALQKKRISGNEGLSHSLFIANGSWQL